MKSHMVLIGLIALAILVAGCTSTGSQQSGNATATAQPSNTTTPSNPASSSAASTFPVNASYNFSGHGVQSTDRFYLNGGLTTFNSTNARDVPQEPYFGAALYDSNGTYVDIIADTSVEMNVKHNTVVRSPGYYYINVNTKNGWNISIVQ